MDPNLIISASLSFLRLIAQWRADGSLTDDQLQQAALQEDADTQSIVKDFLKQLR